MRRVLIALAILLLSIPTFAQTEYGKPDELRNLRKVFVETNGDMKNRERIHEVIQKSDLPITLLDSEEGAEVILVFGGGKEQMTRGSISNGVGSIFTRKVNVGEGKVFVRSGDKLRVVMSYEGEEKHMWEKKPATNFGKRFVKAWKKANDLK